MPSFLERYQQGEHEQVWRDLEKLGARVRDEQFLADAEAVARETMKRVRDNAETLVTRLEKLGYQFISSLDEQDEAFESMRRTAQTTDTLGAAMQKIRAGSRSTDELPFVKAAREQLLAQREKFAEAQAMLAAQPESRKKPPAIAPPHPGMADDIAEYEAAIGGPLPLSVRAWCEMVGSVSLLGTHPELCPRMARREPVLYLNPGSRAHAEQKVAQLLAWGVNAASEIPDVPEPPLADPLIVSCQLYEDEDYEDGEDTIHHLIIGPDEMYKAGIYGSGDMYWMDVPNRDADAPFEEWHATSFVDYLRITFKWGGFPGWERYPDRPQKELSYLAEGLLPL